MNGFKDFSRGLVVVLLGLASFAASVASAQPVTPVTIANGNSSALVDVDSSMGMYQWNIDGHNQLAQQWFWYRVGNTGVAQPINTIGSRSYDQAGGANYLFLSYNNNQVGIEITYSITGGAYGQSQIKESITLINNGPSQIDYHFFQYSDFDLAGTPGGDSITIFGNPTTGFYEARQVKGASQIAETITRPWAGHAEVSGVTGAVRDRLNTVDGLQLNDSTFATGDASWAYEWDFTLAPGATQEVFKDKTLNVVPVPEPGSMGFIGVGLVAWLIRRKR